MKFSTQVIFHKTILTRAQCLSFHSSKFPVSTKPECHKHGYILNAESDFSKTSFLQFNFQFLWHFKKYSTPCFVVTGSLEP
jgi:hypothetical protein